jgi:hypothetical protein
VRVREVMTTDVQFIEQDAAAAQARDYVARHAKPR